MSLPVVCILACAGVLLDWSDAFPISTSHSRGEPNVVMQSVVVGKKSQLEDDDCEQCPKCSLNNMKAMLKNMFQSLQPESVRLKREDKGNDDEDDDLEAFDEKTIDRLIQLLEEMKRDRVRSRNEEAEEVDEREPERKKHKGEDEENDQRKGKKSDRYRDRTLEDDEEYPRHKKEHEGMARKKQSHKNKDWRQEEQDRRNRLRQELADSWPKTMTEDDHIYLPLQVRRGSHHPRGIGGYLR